MKIYSDVGIRRVLQVVGDLMVLSWIAGWAAVGYVVYRITHALGTPGRKLAEAGDSLAGNLRETAGQAGGIPAVGDKVRVPLDSAAGAASRMAEAGRDQQHAAEQLAWVLGTVTIAVPVLFALLIWLPPRIRFSRRATAARRFVDSAADLRLFALRAMANQPMHRLAAISDDPLEAWQGGDEEVINRLAALELRSSGLRLRTG